MEILLTIITVIVLFISITYVAKKRKETGITDLKTALTPICFYLIAIINLIAIWTDSFGLLVWTFNILLLFLAAYFTKFFPDIKQEN